MRRTIVIAAGVLAALSYIGCTSNNAAELVGTSVSEQEITQLRLRADSLEKANKQLRAENKRLRLDSVQALLMLQNVDNILANVSNSAWHAGKSIQLGRKKMKSAAPDADAALSDAWNDVVEIQNAVGEL